LTVDKTQSIIIYRSEEEESEEIRVKSEEWEEIRVRGRK
jgi:hypothetical protein